MDDSVTDRTPNRTVMTAMKTAIPTTPARLMNFIGKVGSRHTDTSDYNLQNPLAYIRRMTRRRPHLSAKLTESKTCYAQRGSLAESHNYPLVFTSTRFVHIFGNCGPIADAITGAAASPGMHLKNGLDGWTSFSTFSTGPIVAESDLHEQKVERR